MVLSLKSAPQVFPLPQKAPLRCSPPLEKYPSGVPPPLEGAKIG